MAVTSFKQQCPSCEALVPIRDPNLIGKKIDCPKCKYRFVVEDPGPAEEEEAVETPAAEKPRGKGTSVKGKGGPRRRDDDEAADGKRGKKSGSGKLVVGVALGVVAVGLLVAVAIFMFMKNDAPKSSPSPSPTRVANNSAPAAPAESAAPAEPAPAEEGEKPAQTPVTPAVAAALPVSPEALTNMLPNDTEGVCNVRMKDLMRTSLGRTIFATPGAFRSEAIQHRLGLAVEDIDLLVESWNFTQNWTFNVIHTTRAINQEAVKTALRARPAPEGRIEDQEYFLLEPNPWLDSLGTMTFALLLQLSPSQVPAQAGNRALRIVDDQTLILADLGPLKQFLAVKGRFPPKAPPKEAAPKDAEAENTPSPARGGPVPRGRGLPPASPPAGESGTPDENAPPPPSGAYLTVNPNLKTILDLLDRKQPVLTLALDTQAAARGHLPPLGVSVLEGTLNAAALAKLALKTIFEEAGVLGAALHLRDGMELTLAEDCQNEETARRRTTTIQQETGPELAKMLTAVLGTRVEMLDENAGNSNNPFGGDGGRNANPGAGRGQPFMPVPGGPPRAAGISSGATRPGTITPFGGGPTSGMGRGGNFASQTPQPEERPKPGSTIKLDNPEKNLLLLTVSLTDPGANTRLMHGKLRQLVLRQKGYLDMAGGQLRIHDLGDAARRYAEAHGGELPRGTLERPIPSTRAGRPYEPKQRLSGLAELLPYLGPEQTSLYRGLDRTKSWDDPENLGAAATLVPQFLDPHYPSNTWWVHYPGMSEPTAATHFVGIAGIGADAAEYSANDPTVAKKLGVFGYDRTTRLQDITDGAANTIMLAQVPPLHKRPWLAGGGSTVQGVLEKDSVKPFVSPQADGKRGSLVVMADGSVRFVSENIKDEVFKALCTIKGGETGLIIDRDAPSVPRPEGAGEPATLVAQAPPSSPGLPKEPKETTSKSGGYTAAFPGTPTETKLTQKTPLGDLEMHLAVVQTPSGGSYTVIYNDLPEAVAKQPAAADLVLDTIPQQVKANVPGANVVGDIKKLTQDGYPGRELTLDLPGKGTLLVRVFLAKHRVYQIMVGGSKDFLASKEAQHFLDSFHLENQ